MADNDLVARGLDRLSVGVGIYDSDLRLVFSNLPFKVLREYPDRLCEPGTPLEDMLRFNAERGDFGPGDVDELVAERMVQVHDASEREIERETGDGRILQIRYNRLADGGLTVSFEDKTEERRAQQALAVSGERLALVARATSDGLYDWNVVPDTLFVSDRLNELFAFGDRHIESRQWADRIHEDDLPHYLSTLRAHLGGTSDHLECEYRIIGKDGDYRWVHDRGIGVRDADGRVVRLVGAVSDVTDIKAAAEELDNAEKRLLESLDTISDGFLLVDSQDRVQLWNRRYMEIFGAAAGADISDIVTKGRPFLDMIRDGYDRGMFKSHPGGADGWIAGRREARKTPAAQLEIELSNGTWLLVNERRMSDGGRVSVYTDITDFKRREETLEAARTRFEDAIEALSSGFVLYDADDRLVVCNTKYREYFPELSDMVSPGTSFADIIRAAMERGVFPASSDNPQAWLAALLDKRASASGMREQYLEGGVWLQISDHRTKDGGIVSIYTDVTELKNKQTELRDREIQLSATLAEFNAVLDTIDYGVLFMGPDLKARVINRAFGRIWQIPQSYIDERPTMRELIEVNRGKGLYDVAAEDWEAWAEERVESVRRGDIAPSEVKRGDGSIVQYQCIALPDGGRMLTYFDITDLKRREADLTEAKNAAEQALQDLRKAQERLVQSEKMASLGQLTAGIAHEIKNPLNFVNNFAKLSAELLGELGDVLEEPIAALGEDERDDAEDLFDTLKGNLEKINEHGRRADGIVKNMLLHSRDGPGELQSSNLNTIAEEALNLAYHGARAENSEFNIRMVKTMAEDLGDIECYPQDLMRVFLNLISNGMYAANKAKASAGDPSAAREPTISIETRGHGDDVVVEIRDNGTGIPADIRDKIFTPFFTTKPPGEGTGLGLSLSYDIIAKQHGGTMTVDSEPGEFTAFVVTLPRVMAETTLQGGVAT